MPTLTKKAKRVCLFSGLLFLVMLHFILYSLDDGKWKYDESFVHSAYATAAAELGLVVITNVLGRIVCFLLLGPYIFVIGLAVMLANIGGSSSSAPYAGSEVHTGYSQYLMFFPFVVSIVLFLGLIRVIGYFWPLLSND